MILEVVLSVPLWIGVVAGLGVMGMYGIVVATFSLRSVTAEAAEAGIDPVPEPALAPRAGNGHGQYEPTRHEREPVLTH